MSNSLWAYAKLGFNPGVQVLDVAARRVMLSLHQYNSQELANMLFSFATLEHHPGVQLLETAAVLLHVGAALLVGVRSCCLRLLCRLPTC